MSFSKQVKEELNSIQIKGNCCKKAYLFGAFLSAENNCDTISLKISDGDSAQKIISLLGTIYKCTPAVNITKRGCFESTDITFKSKKIAEFLSFADNFNDESLMNGIFTCKSCHSAFLRGAFCSFGSVSDPQKTYCLEMRVKNHSRAALLSCIVGNADINTPSVTNRSGGIGLFYRNESSIEDFLTVCGANKSLFSFFETSLEKDLRNSENRATNCVTRNILKSVEATALQISAIEALKSVNAFNDLPRELKHTAELRVANPDMSLGELADLHIPRISKSGLNHRLSKIIEEAKKLKLIL